MQHIIEKTNACCIYVFKERDELYGKNNLDQKETIELLKEAYQQLLLFKEKVGQNYYDNSKKEEYKAYLEDVLKYAYEINKEYAEGFATILILPLGHISNLEWTIAKEEVIIEFLESINKSSNKEDPFINVESRKKILEYAKKQNPQVFKQLKRNLIDSYLDDTKNKWQRLNIIALINIEPLEIDEKECIIKRLNNSNISDPFIYKLLLDGIDIGEHRKVIIKRLNNSNISDSDIYKLLLDGIDIGEHRKVIIEGINPTWSYKFGNISQTIGAEYPIIIEENGQPLGEVVKKH